MFGIRSLAALGHICPNGSPPHFLFPGLDKALSPLQSNDCVNGLPLCLGSMLWHWHCSRGLRTVLPLAYRRGQARMRRSWPIWRCRKGGAVGDRKREGIPRGGCPYLCTQAGPQEQVTPGSCGDPLSASSFVPDFWQYWNRCTAAKHILCRRYRCFRRWASAMESQARPSIRRSA